jgi:transcriptional regulator with XRE-family HTH domain
MSEYNPITVGNRIRDCRNLLGLTQDNLADLLDMKRSNIAGYEKGRVMPTAIALFKMANIFEVSIDYLLAITELKEPVTYDESKEKLRLENVKLKRTILQVKEVVANDVFAVLSDSIK